MIDGKKYSALHSGEGLKTNGVSGWGLCLGAGVIPKTINGVKGWGPPLGLGPGLG